ncbi:MAG TPA: tRNA (adenosine(37)-N6)-threonylcarbamoyltransferase complex dimerization subunit type 1 TsaB [Candidatus Eremiobacteraceae bacterium]|nr:tRNA (adenosine(37)-N6)-threonylcarbamoyltransferase complex dimerization subunit type 1 TsaB [Candidatus Eremiobacteraceae bacterium]
MSAAATLGFTSAGRVGVALEAGGVWHLAQPEGQALEALLPAIRALLARARIDVADIGLLGVCTGPGSFTGLRIGVALAKSIAQARAVPLIGVSSYDVAEAALPDDAYPRVAIVEGKRGYHYRRTTPARDAEPEFAHGDVAVLPELEARAAIAQLFDLPAAEQAARVARIAAARAAHGSDVDWRRVAIDYGQRPNAVTNWESRARASQGVGAAESANPPRE